MWRCETGGYKNSKKKSLEAIVHTLKAILKAKELRAILFHIHAIGPALLTPLARLLARRFLYASRSGL